MHGLQVRAIGFSVSGNIAKTIYCKSDYFSWAIATIAGLFPAFAMKLLGFVALYGFILAPFGAIIVFEHFFYKQAGIVKNYAEVAKLSFNKAVFLAWAISFGLFYFISIQFDVFLSFVTLPAWVLCGVLFLLFSKYYQKK